MEAVLAVAVVLVLVALGYLLYTRLSARAGEKRLARDKLRAVAAGHREMADAHAGSVDELAPKAKAHREAAQDHARRADELEGRIERERRQAQFHAERAEQTDDARERI